MSTAKRAAAGELRSWAHALITTGRGSLPGASGTTVMPVTSTGLGSTTCERARQLSQAAGQVCIAQLLLLLDSHPQ